MPVEIERKFLVRRDLWRPDPATGVACRQGYLCIAPERVVRVRIAGSAAYLTIKGSRIGIARPEFEYPVPRDDAEFMLDHLCIAPVIIKRRYRVPFQGHIWEVDEFEGENAGLVTAEIELSAPDTPFEAPPWVGAEVSSDPRYGNASLVRHPFRAWTTSG